MTFKRWAARRMKQVLCLIAISLAILAMWTVGSLVVASWQLRALMNQERDKGYPVTIEELAETLPMPAQDQNAANVYRRAFSMEPKLTDEYRALVPIEGDLEFEVSEPLSAETMQATRSYLEANSQYLSLLHEAADMPECRFVDLGKTSGANLPWNTDYPAASIRCAARHLVLEALYAGEVGDSGRAVDSLMAALHTAKAAANDPGELPRIIGNTLAGVVVSCVTLSLSRHALPDDGLERIAEGLSEGTDINRTEKLFLEQRVLGMAELRQIGWDDAWPAFGGVTWHVDGERHQVTGLLAVPVAIRTTQYAYGGQKAWDQLAHFEVTTAISKIAVLAPEERLKAGEALDRKFDALPRSRVYARTISHAALHMKACLRDLALRRAATTGIAVERFRLANGRLPESLDELVPGWLETIPQDPFDAKPLRYNVNGPSYCVYSVGQDLVDNGGQEERKKGGDVSFRVERSVFPLTPVVMPPPQTTEPSPGAV